jgi:hypothetical protein
VTAVPAELVAGALSALVGLASAAYKRQARREDRVDRRLSSLERALVRIEVHMGIDRDDVSDVPESDPPKSD